MSGLGPELKPLCNRGQKKSRFHHGERRADALPRPSAEREIGKLRDLLRFLGPPAVGIESLWFWKIFRITMHDPSAHHHVRSRRDAIAGKFEFFDHSSRQAPRWRIKPQGFLDHPLGVA